MTCSRYFFHPPIFPRSIVLRHLYGLVIPYSHYLGVFHLSAQSVRCKLSAQRSLSIIFTLLTVNLTR
ncbi:hypothetical protein WJX82_005603 [Trebouxia sp. C0006]